MPELGLDERGTIALEYGARRFTVGFDELLVPFVRNEAGVRLAGLPHVGKDDDAEKGSAAQLAWKTLKDDVRTIGAEQSKRLERTMVSERSWSVEAFVKHLVAHRLLGHLARRLVFGVLDGKAIRATFRIAEDGSFADRDDHALALSSETRVVIVHRARIDEETRASWQRTFDDYEIVQPFLQMARESVTLAEDEMATTLTKHFVGMRAHGGAFFSLRQRGWKADWSTAVTKHLTPSLRARLAIEPGIESFATKPEDQTLGVLELHGRTFSALAPIIRFELLRDVELLVAR